MIELPPPVADYLPGLWVILGLFIGSFLNVVAHRLPLMLQREWKTQCHKLLNLEEQGPDDNDSATKFKVFNLARPASHCPHCRYRIKPWENIPVLSYLLLRGRCSGCHRRIALRYPVIELLTGLLSGLVAFHFGTSWLTLTGLLFTWCLLVLTLIDWDHQLLPDNLTLPLLWLGLMVNAVGLGPGVSLFDAVTGAMAGYLSLWIFYWLFRILTGKEGMGYGDFKLLAALGAWLGWQSLLPIIILSSVAGATVGVALVVMAGHERTAPMPFGPFLAGAGFVMLIWGEQLHALYVAAMPG